MWGGALWGLVLAPALGEDILGLGESCPLGLEWEDKEWMGRRWVLGEQGSREEKTD